MDTKRTPPATSPPGGKVDPARSAALVDRAKSTNFFQFGAPVDAPGPRFVRPVPPVDCIQALRERQYVRAGLLDRLADALSGDRFFFWFLGFSAGLALAAVFVAAFPPMTFR